MNSIVTYFLRSSKDIANLLTLGSLTIKNENHGINLQETFMHICRQTINYITHFFLKILQRNSTLVILGNLGMPGHKERK